MCSVLTCTLAQMQDMGSFHSRLEGTVLELVHSQTMSRAAIGNMGLG